MKVEPVESSRTLTVAGNWIVGLKNEILRSNSPNVEPPVQLAEGVLIWEAVVHQLLKREPISLAAGKASALQPPNKIGVWDRRSGLALGKGSAAQGRRA
jgi:hypothetical protein